MVVHIKCEIADLNSMVQRSNLDYDCNYIYIYILGCIVEFRIGMCAIGMSRCVVLYCLACVFMTCEL